MKTKPISHAKKVARRTKAGSPEVRCLLRLFVAGASTRSRQAVLRVRSLCETELKGNFSLEVIDIYQQPELARKNQIVATPTLIKECPRPLRRFIGGLSDLSGFLPQHYPADTGRIAI